MSRNSYFSTGDDVRADGAKSAWPRDRGVSAPSDRHPSSQPEPTPDLHSHCPVCGKAYQTGEEMVMLASTVFWAGAVPAEAGRDTEGNAFLGHRACVLPRLLTLLASFQPANRFERASRDFAAGGGPDQPPSESA